MTDRHQQKPYPLRMTPDVREALEARSSGAGRSLHAEILAALDAWIEGVGDRKEIDGLRFENAALKRALDGNRQDESAVLVKLEELYAKGATSVLGPTIQAGYFARAFQYVWRSIKTGAALSVEIQSALEKADSLAYDAIDKADAASVEQFKLMRDIVQFTPSSGFRDELSALLDDAERGIGAIASNGAKGGR